MLNSESRDQINLPECLGSLIDKCFVVRTDVLVGDARENAHLIERIFLLFVGQLAHLDFL